MPGFESLPEAIDLNAALQPITADETAFADEQMSDDTALGLVLQDTQAAITYLQSKGLLPQGIDQADDLVRAYVKPRTWADGKPRANMPFFTVLEAIEKIMPVLYMSMFGTGKKRPFAVEPKGKTTAEAARAKASVLQWCIKKSGLKETMRLTLKSCLTYGFCMGFYGWETVTHKKRTFAKGPDGKLKREWKEIEISVPTYENMSLKRVLFDPHCDRQDIQKGARFVIKQSMITANDLENMRQNPDVYIVANIPSREQLRDILSRKDEPTEDSLSADKRTVWREFQAELEVDATSVDPLNQNLEYLEYWSGDRVIGVLQRKIVLRNQGLGEEFDGIPGVSCAFVDILGSAWGFGVARLCAGDQRFQTGVGNNYIDSLALVLNPVYQLLKGIGPGTQNVPLSPGKIINVGGELKPLQTPDVSKPALEAIETSNDWASRRVAANGGSNMPTQALRTGTGVQAFTGDIVQRLQYFIEIFANLVYLPVLEGYLRIALEKLDPEQINHILSEEEGKAWEGDITDVYNADINVGLVAGADLMAKFAAAQLAPMFTQFMANSSVQESLQVQGKYFDYAEFAEETCDLLGWDIDQLFKPLTPEMQAAAQQQNQQYAKGVADANLQAQKHQDDMELAGEKGYIQGTVGMVKQAVKSHLDTAQNALESLQDQASNDGQQEGA